MTYPLRDDAPVVLDDPGGLGCSVAAFPVTLAGGPRSVLVLQAEEDVKKIERMIPFVSTFVDKVDTAARCITVDWQADY